MGLEASASDRRFGFAGSKVASPRLQLISFILFMKRTPSTIQQKVWSFVIARGAGTKQIYEIIE
jgi:hypothetical protein